MSAKNPVIKLKQLTQEQIEAIISYYQIELEQEQKAIKENNEPRRFYHNGAKFVFEFLFGSKLFGIKDEI